jgi:flagellar hook-length control protein FliK
MVAFSVQGKDSEEDSLKIVAPAGGKASVDSDAKKSSRVDIPVRESLDTKNTVKGETVIRQVPSGGSVANPAQTVELGKSPFHMEMTTVTGQGRETEEQPVREKDESVEVVSSTLPSEADRGNARIHASSSSSSGEGAFQQNSGEGRETSAVSLTISPSGNFDTTLRGRTEIGSNGETLKLHESILSQVREKLASPEAGNGNGQITLKLNPRELGDLQIHLRMEDAKVSVEITAQNPAVREALAQNIDQLKETLSQRNIAMERCNVMTGNGQTSNQSFRDGRQAAQRYFEDPSFPGVGYYTEDPGKATLAYGESRENSLVDMRF